MTQRNIDIMDIIVSKMTEGDTLSKALQRVYNKRNVAIPYDTADFDVEILSLNMSNRTTNALMRAKLVTLGDVIRFCGMEKITTIRNFGHSAGIELFETILNYCWDKMNQDEKTVFLIDTVERNTCHIKAELM